VHIDECTTNRGPARAMLATFKRRERGGEDAVASGTARSKCDDLLDMDGLDVIAPPGHAHAEMQKMVELQSQASQPLHGLEQKLIGLDASNRQEGSPCARAMENSPVSMVSGGRSPLRSPVGRSPLRSPAARSPLRSPVERRGLVQVRSPMRSPVASPIASPRVRSPIRKRNFGRTSSVAAADEAMEKIRAMRSGLIERMSSSNDVLNSAQKMIDECGDAIAKWFGALSGPALEAAIKQAFLKFDADGSAEIDLHEFSQAMHTLGLRLNTEQYKVLFKECDIDGGGSIDLEEFSHMVKKFLKKPCSWDCKPCELTGGSNQAHRLYGIRWSDDQSLVQKAACTMQAFVLATLARQMFLRVTQDVESLYALTNFDGSDIDFGTFMRTQSHVTYSTSSPVPMLPKNSSDPLDWESMDAAAREAYRIAEAEKAQVAAAHAAGAEEDCPKASATAGGSATQGHDPSRRRVAFGTESSAGSDGQRVREPSSTVAVAEAAARARAAAKAAEAAARAAAEAAQADAQNQQQQWVGAEQAISRSSAWVSSTNPVEDSAAGGDVAGASLKHRLTTVSAIGLDLETPKPNKLSRMYTTRPSKYAQNKRLTTAINNFNVQKSFLGSPPNAPPIKSGVFPRPGHGQDGLTNPSKEPKPKLKPLRLDCLQDINSKWQQPNAAWTARLPSLDTLDTFARATANPVSEGREGGIGAAAGVRSLPRSLVSSGALTDRTGEGRRNNAFFTRAHSDEVSISLCEAHHSSRARACTFVFPVFRIAPQYL
jgi:hypothetical protein